MIPDVVAFPAAASTLFPRSRSLAALALALAAAVLTGGLAGCFDGGGTETGNAGAVEGAVHDGGGTETGNTEVFLISIKYLPNGDDSSKVKSARTDAKGRYLIKDVDAGRYALGIPGSGETPLSAVQGRITTVQNGKAKFDLTVRPSLTLVGRVLPDSGQPATAVRVCVPGLLRCADAASDSTYRIQDAPMGAYELVFLSPAHAHYLSIQVKTAASGTVHLRDLALQSRADADHVPYSFYDVGRSASFSSLPMRYPPGAAPAWYAGKDFDQVDYFLLSEIGAPKPWNGDYLTAAYRDSLVLSGASLLGVDLSAPIQGFPLPVRLTAANFDFAKAKGGAADLIVTDGADQVLAHQVERWDSSAARADLWIRFPTLAAAASGRIAILRWNRDTAFSPPPPAGSVFRREDGFIGAWHLGERGNDSLVSDAQGLHPGRLRGAAPAGGFGALRGEGIIGSGYRFAAKNWINITPDSSQDVSGSMTVAMWVRLSAQDTVSKALFASKWALNKREWHFHIHPSRSLEFEFGDAQGAIVGAWRTVAPLDNLDQWHHYAGTFNNGVVKLYVDGQEMAGVLAPDVPGFKNGLIPKAITRFGSAVNLGTNSIDHTLDLDGDLDEFWYSPEAKSADWIRAAYESQRPRP